MTVVLLLVPPREIATIATMMISTMINPTMTAVVVLMPSIIEPPGCDGCEGCDGWDGCDG